MNTATIALFELPPWVIPGFDGSGLFAIIWWVLKVAIVLASLYLFVVGVLAALHEPKAKGSESTRRTARNLIPVLLGVGACACATYHVFQYGYSPWLLLGVSIVFALFGLVIGSLGRKFWITVSLIGLLVWYSWPLPKNYAIAIKEVVVPAVSDKFSEIWSSFAHSGKNSTPESGMSDELVRLLKEGVASIRLGNVHGAISSFRSAHRIDPICPEPLLNLALVHDQADKPIVAICWYHAYLRVAPLGETRSAVHARMSALDEELRQELKQLTAVSAEVAAAQFGGARWGDLQTIARVQAEFGDVAGALSNLEKIRTVDPSVDNWSGSCLLVAFTLADQGLIDVAESFCPQINSDHAAVLREKITNVRNGVLSPNPSEYFAPLADAEAIKMWGEYADLIPSGGHHHWHALDLFVIDTSHSPSPGPEMGIGSFIDGLISRKERSAESVMDGVIRLFLTHREIRRRSSRQPTQWEGSASGTALSLAEVVKKSNQFLERYLKSAEPGTNRQ